MSSPEPVAAHTPSLGAVARASIAHGLRGRGPLDVDPGRFPASLRGPGASFVTLRLHEELRGCTGTLVAARPLACDVAHNAWRSAFDDPRFPPVTAAELQAIEIHVSVLSPLEPLDVGSEAELLAVLRPGIDGLVLRDGSRAATFLPAVWESLPEPLRFLDQLRQKAGLASGHWSPTLRFQRYTARDAV